MRCLGVAAVRWACGRGGGGGGPTAVAAVQVLQRSSMRFATTTTFGKPKAPAIEETRNIGIVAHIDAGKTTTTERMLFYTGTQQRIGEVDDGTTTTDYMEEEMQRGITIQSAAVSFDWRSHRINLIDTPGHVDFTVEVERSLRVLDGVVALFDASAGVQAQSYTVLRQAQKNDIPVIAFINKMDKMNANFAKSVESLRTKLQVEPLCIQAPIYGLDGGCEGIVDLITMDSIRFGGKRNQEMVKRPVTEEDEYVQASAREARGAMLDVLSCRDDAIATALIESIDQHNGDEVQAQLSVPAQQIRDAIRKLVREQPPLNGEAQVVPVMCGASRRDIGVQPLLDAVVDFLPSPKDRPILEALDAEGQPVDGHPPVTTAPTVALAFKVVHQMNKAKGKRVPLVFLRVYSGQLTKNSRVWYPGRFKGEPLTQLFVMHADEPRPVDRLDAGSIGATFLNEAATGDTLLVESQRESNPVHSLRGIDVPEPVLSHGVETATKQDEENLKSALEMLAKEDPSFHVSENTHGQTVVSGMGELHLEVMMSRLQREYDLKCTFTRAIIEYRESLREGVNVDGYRYIGAGGQPVFVAGGSITTLLDDENVVEPGNNVQCYLSEEGRRSFVQALAATAKDQGRTLGDSKVEDQLNYIQRALQNAVKQLVKMGPFAGRPLIGFAVSIDFFQSLTPKVEMKKVEAGFAKMLADMLANLPEGSSCLLEPWMTVEAHVTDAKFLGTLMADFTQRGASSVEVLDDGMSIQAVVPMRKITKYSSHVRSLCKGNVYYWATLKHYRAVTNAQLEQQILDVLR